jgi:hypothetical protein
VFTFLSGPVLAIANAARRSRSDGPRVSLIFVSEPAGPQTLPLDDPLPAVGPTMAAIFVGEVSHETAWLKDSIGR